MSCIVSLYSGNAQVSTVAGGQRAGILAAADHSHCSVLCHTLHLAESDTPRSRTCVEQLHA